MLTVVATLAVAAPASFDRADARSSGPASAVFDAGVETTIADIQAFWASALPEAYGVRYEPVPEDRLFPYSEAEPPPSCADGGRTRTPYEKVAGNAFYCGNGDFVAWDDQELFPTLEQRYGRFAVALVLAHEWGHAVQARVGAASGPTVYLELQADCFAGAWAHHVEQGDDPTLTLGAGDLDTALGGYLEFRDPPGVDPGQSGAHGNAFDRVSGFQDGYESGTARCADYESSPPEVTESAYDDYQDATNGGDVPFDEIESTLVPSLDGYWSVVAREYDAPADVIAYADGDAPSCDASDGGVLADEVTYCADTGVVAYDGAFLEVVYARSGDFGVGMLLAGAWSSAVQHDLGREIGTGEAQREADCLTGSWAGSVWRGEQTDRESAVSLSPGDLDEAIRAFVVFGAGDRGSAFERVQAFRFGFSSGADACDAPREALASGA